MWLIIISLVLGILLGVYGRLPEIIVSKLNSISTCTMFLMLAALGAQIGSDAELLRNICIIGYRAFIISVLSVLGSVLLLWLAVRLFNLSSQEKESV